MVVKLAPTNKDFVTTVGGDGVMARQKNWALGHIYTCHNVTSDVLINVEQEFWLGWDIFTTQNI